MRASDSKTKPNSMLPLWTAASKARTLFPFGMTLGASSSAPKPQFREEYLSSKNCGPGMLDG